MADPSLEEIMGALAGQLQGQLAGTADPAIAGLNVYPLLNDWNPTPPAIDIYPSDPAVEQTAFGHGSRDLFLTVRARVSTADSEGGQSLLLSMMDPISDQSVIAAIAYDETLSGKVSQAHVISGPSGFQVYGYGDDGHLLGSSWNVRVARV